VTIGRLLGVPVRVHWTMLLLIGGAVAAGQGWAVALAAIAVVTHELAHVAVARSLGLDVAEVELWPFGGRADLVGLESQDPAVESMVAVAGPVASLLLASVTRALETTLPGPNPLAGFFVSANVALALLNLLPALPLDGGRIWRALRAGRVGYRRAEAEVRRAGYAVSMALAMVSMAAAAFSRLLWQPLVLAGFLLWASRAPSRALYWVVRDLAVRQAAFLTRPVWTLKDYAVREDALLRDVLGEMRPRQLHRVAVLTLRQEFLGTLWERDILAGLADLGPDATVGELLHRQN
jgi:stage IV sporulation protein FB